MLARIAWAIITTSPFGKFHSTVAGAHARPEWLQVAAQNVGAGLTDRPILLVMGTLAGKAISLVVEMFDQIRKRRQPDRHQPLPGRENLFLRHMIKAVRIADSEPERLGGGIGRNELLDQFCNFIGRQLPIVSIDWRGSRSRGRAERGIKIKCGIDDSPICFRVSWVEPDSF